MAPSDCVPDYQSAYRKNYSCETALVKIVNDLLCNMEEQKLTALTAIDLSAAFDTVDHEVLIKVLQNSSGLNDQVLKWYESYLQHLRCVLMNNIQNQDH